MPLLTSFATDLRVEGFATTTIAQYLGRLRKVPFELPGTRREVKDHLAARREFTSVNDSIVELRALKAFARWHAAEYGTTDELAAMPFPKPTKALPGRVAKADDVDKLIRKMSATPPLWSANCRDIALVRLLELTGCRRSEAARLTVDDLDFERERISFRDTKSHESRWCPMHPRLRQALNRWLTKRATYRIAEDTDRLFLGHRQPLSADGIGAVFDRLARDYGIALTPHTFRRGFAHRWAEAGMPDDSLMAAAGWRSSRMPSMYRAELLGERVRLDYARAFAKPEGTISMRAKPGRRAN